MTVHEVRIDKSKTLLEEPATGHNRWHPDILPVVRCQPGDEVVLETRDALDGQAGPGVSADALATPDLDVVHPLTGPVYVEGAEPGDLLAVEILDIEPDRYGFTVQLPGFGFLRDEFPEPYIVKWRISEGWATSAELRGVRIPDASFMGTIGVAPSEELRREMFRREEELRGRGGFVLPPDPAGAVPARDPIASHGLRTIPPRENGGNTDIKQMVKGTTLLFPCFVDGCMLSVGDVHWAQGDGEVSGTAIEMNATLHVRFSVRKGEAAQKNIRDLRFTRQDYYLPPEYAAPRRFYATTGISVTKDGVNHSEDITLAARNALLNMIEHLTERGWTRQQGYAICSVAVDLKISQLVDAPNMLVSAFLPEDIFTG